MPSTPNNTCDNPPVDCTNKPTPAQCLNALLPLEKDVNTIQYCSETITGNCQGTQWKCTNDLVTNATSPSPPNAPVLLVNKMFPDAHVFFIGACAVNPTLAKKGEVPVFLQMWDIHDAQFDLPETRDRVIIVPVGNSVNLGGAAGVWRFILYEMTVYGYTVKEALADANLANPNQQFAAYRNTSVKF